MTKKEIAQKAARNREIQARMREIYLGMEKEKRSEYNEAEAREINELKHELDENRREILLSGDEQHISEMREQIDRNKQYREYLQGVRQKREDNTTTLAPKGTPDGSSISESGAIVLNIQDIIDTKENGLGRPYGQSFVTGVQGDELYPYSINDVEMEEVGEIDAVNDQDLKFDNIKVTSRRVSLSVAVSNAAIDNAAFDLVSFVLYKIRKAWEIYFAKKNYSHAAWQGNKGAFSLVTPGTLTLDSTIGAQIDDKFADMAELGFDEEGCVIISPKMEAKLKHTYEGNGNAAHPIIENGLLCGHPYVSTKHVNYKLNGSGKYVKDSDEYIGIGLFQYLPIQQHGLVRQTVDATSAAVAKVNKTVIVFSTEISITELSALVNGGDSNTPHKPQAFALFKVTEPASTSNI
jgi:hypothetical protein